MAAALKGVVIDAFDTALAGIGIGGVPDAFGYLMREKGLEEQEKAQHKHVLLTQETSLQAYAAELFPAADLPEVLTQAEILFARQIAHYQLRPEWPAFLAELQAHSLQLCVGSNLASPYTSSVRDKITGADHFVFSCQIGKAKPDVAFFQECCSRMGTNPEETVMIGNSFTSDIKGAKAAGFQDMFWLPGKNRPIRSDHFLACKMIDNLCDIFHYENNSAAFWCAQGYDIQ